MYVFLTEYSDQFGYAGQAYLGTLCGDKRARVSIVAYFDNDIYAAEVKSVSGLTFIMTFFIPDSCYTYAFCKQSVMLTVNF